MQRQKSIAKLSVLRAWGVNHAQALTTSAVFVVTVAFSLGTNQPQMKTFANIVLSCLTAGASWLSYGQPKAALVAVGALCVGSPLLSTTSFAALELMVVFVLFQVVWRSDLDPRLVATVGLASLTINDIWLERNTDSSLSGPAMLYPAILTALGVGLGYQGRQLRRQHSELVSLQHALRERAVLSERHRIARDLHDVAAHHLSALVVQNKVARRLGTKESLQEAADFSAQTALDALDALRHVVGVLSTDSPLEPQPTLNDLDPMFDRLAAAGLIVHRHHFKHCFETGQVRRDVELAIIRIAQEALTNILRHRGPGNAWFDLTVSDGTIRLTIENDGTATEETNDDTTKRDRYGLINMTERAKSTGGTLNIDASPRGGWRVCAVLPYSAAS